MSGNAQTKVVIGATVAAGTLTAAGLVYLYKKKMEQTPPTKWKKVGEIVDMNCFPVKSLAPIKRDIFDCHELGLESGKFRDRMFMVVSPENHHVTARTYPKMLLIQPKIEGDKLILTAPNKPDIELNVDELKQQKTTKAFVWNTPVKVIDAGDAVASWISEFLLDAKDGLRLVFYPESRSTRNACNRAYKHLMQVDSGALQDVTGFMLMNQASVDDLNTHLDHVVKPLQFRPNFLVKGPKAYEEENWKWVRIGDCAVFRNVKPCERCIFTNINPESAERNPNREPQKTLAKIHSTFNNSPIMGTHLGLRARGKVSIGDAVYVEDEA